LWNPLPERGRPTSRQKPCRPIWCLPLRTFTPLDHSRMMCSVGRQPGLELVQNFGEERCTCAPRQVLHAGKCLGELIPRRAHVTDRGCTHKKHFIYCFRVVRTVLCMQTRQGASWTRACAESW
jgi:hypothetical protein